MQYCNCHSVLSIKDGVKGLLDEVIEFIEEPSLDELSDISYSINRIAGTFIGKPYMKVVPGDGLHVMKIRKRMNSHGCIRSQRHLVQGKCPSA